MKCKFVDSYLLVEHLGNGAQRLVFAVWWYACSIFNWIFTVVCGVPVEPISWWRRFLALLMIVTQTAHAAVLRWTHGRRGRVQDTGVERQSTSSETLVTTHIKREQSNLYILHLLDKQIATSYLELTRLKSPLKERVSCQNLINSDKTISFLKWRV